MRIIGIDLAASPKNTGVVVLQLDRSNAVAGDAATGLDDDALVELARDASMLAVDCALGWPARFIERLTSHHGGGDWPDADRTNLRYRETDIAMIEAGSRPLSVSTDMLGVTALRCAHLQSRWRREIWNGVAIPRDGSAKLVEVYPAAALRTWNLRRPGYKKNSSTRAELLVEIGRMTDGWLDISRVEQHCVASDHVFDALVCALVGVAVNNGKTLQPSRAQQSAAEVEGWIHSPTCELERLRSSPD